MSIAQLAGLTAIVTIWLGAKPGVGYLAKVGPAPLRFQAPSRGPEVTVLLPPLATIDPEPEPEFYGPPAPEEPIASPPATTLTNVAAPVIPLALPDPNAALTPQMLIQFFNDRSRSNQDYGVLVPFQFNPPPATTIPPPPSRATYQLK